MARRSHAGRYLRWWAHATDADGLGRLAAVRVRAIELRLLAGALTALWATAFALVLIGYRPGGPIDVAVGLAALPPMLIALVALRWPPVARGDRAFAAIAWLGLGSLLLLIPSLADIIVQLQGRGPQTLLPSPEAAYPWSLALLGTGLFAGLGAARRLLGEGSRRRHRFVRGAVLGGLAAVLAGSVFGGAAVANELALRDTVVAGSRFGPTDPSVEPPSCDGPLLAGATARLEGTIDLEIDGKRVGRLTLSGERSGADVRWQGYIASEQALGRVGLARVGDEAWSLEPGSTWVPEPLDEAAHADLDRAVVDTALTPSGRAVAELHGIDVIDGARARHCRVVLTGAAFRTMAPEAAKLIGSADISRWLGELDFWVFTDDQLGRVDAHVNGSAGDLADDALLGTLRFQLTAVDRGQPLSIANPRDPAG
jgi:hypothetical protein